MNTFSNDTPYAQLGGEPRVRVLTQQFYDLMQFESKYAALRAVHHEDLNGARDKLFLFLSGWLGGPPLYVEQYGHPRLKMRHMPFAIGTRERDQWVACMAQAMRAIEVPEPLFEQLIVSFYNTADWMCNQTDAIEGAPQMPAPLGLSLSSEWRHRLGQLGQTYGVAILSEGV